MTTDAWLYYVTAENPQGGTLAFYQRGSNLTDVERKAREFVAKFTPTYDRLRFVLAGDDAR